MRNFINKIKPALRGQSNLRFIVFIVLFGLIAAGAIIFTKAAGPSVSLESEDGTLSGCVAKVNDTNASGGQGVEFGSDTACPSGSIPYENAGAHLPITYSLSSLTGTLRYVDDNGSDTTGNGSSTAPYQTLAKAVSVAVSGDSIVVKAGTYREGPITVSKSLTIIAAPGEIPTFVGSAPASGWVTEGSYKYIPYTPRLVQDGSGIPFSTASTNLIGTSYGTNSSGATLNEYVGKYADQVWINGAPLKQIEQRYTVTNGTTTTTSRLVDGKFWVDRTNNRLYLTATDAAKSGIEVSSKGRFMRTTAANIKIEGIRVTRYSPNANDYGAFTNEYNADNILYKNVELTETSYQAFVFGYNGSDQNTGSTLQNVTIDGTQWMSVAATFTTNFTLDSVKITDGNGAKEFTNSPASGAMKTSRTRGTRVLNSQIANNRTHGIWFDESNSDTDIANNYIVDNEGAGVFYEISDDLLLINNYIKGGSYQPVKLAGSSGLKLVNNTIFGGYEPIGIFSDGRSVPALHCSDPAYLDPDGTVSSDCSAVGAINSNVDKVRPHPTALEWLPRLDLLINNIVANPTVDGPICGIQPLCITPFHSGSASDLKKYAFNPLNTILHKAISSKVNSSGETVPQTIMNNNVYASSNGNIIYINSPSKMYTSLSAFTTDMAIASGGSYNVGIPGLEANSLFGSGYVNSDGSPTSTLAAQHNQAYSVPSNAEMNAYIPAGTKHYGVTYK